MDRVYSCNEVLKKKNCADFNNATVACYGSSLMIGQVLQIDICYHGYFVGSSYVMTGQEPLTVVHYHGYFVGSSCVMTDQAVLV